MQKFSWLLVLGLFLGCSLSLHAQVEVNGQSYTLVKDLREELLVYSPSYETYVPYVKGTPFGSSAAVFMLPLEHYSNSQLLIQPPAQAALLINESIVDYYWHAGSYLYPMDSLLQHYGDTAVVSLFRAGLNPQELTLALISRQPYSYTESSAETEEFLKAYVRPKTHFSNFFIVGVLVLLSVMAILRNFFPKVFASYYDLSRALAIRVRDEPSFIMKLSGRGHIPFLVFYSLMFGFLLMVLLQQAGKVMSVFDFLLFESFSSYLYAWVLLGLIVFFFQLFKYWLLILAASIFNISDFANIHFFDFLRLSQTFYTFVFALVVLIFLGASAYIDEAALILLRLTALFAILRVLLIYFKLLRRSQFRKSYLFSYLCTTEILPLLVGLKFFII